MDYLFYILIGFLFVCLVWRYYSYRRSERKVEAELAGDKKTADELATTTDELRAGVEKSEELAERIRESESGTDKRIAEAEKAIGRAKEKSRNTVELADECLAILQEAKKTEE